MFKREDGWYSVKTPDPTNTSIIRLEDRDISKLGPMIKLPISNPRFFEIPEIDGIRWYDGYNFSDETLQDIGVERWYEGHNFTDEEIHSLALKQKKFWEEHPSP